MPSINDKISAADDIAVAVTKRVAGAVYPCPECGRETLEHTEQRRICSAALCRCVIEADAARVMEANPLPWSGGAVYPCPKCGRETLEHTEGRRICSAATCREVLDATAARALEAKARG